MLFHLLDISAPHDNVVKEFYCYLTFKHIKDIEIKTESHCFKPTFSLLFFKKKRYGAPEKKIT